MREILTDAQRAALTDETEFAAMVRAIRDVTGDDSIGADTSLRQFARYLLALDTRVRADAGRVDFDAIAKELAQNISYAHALTRPGTDVSIAARVVIYNGMQRLLGHLLTDTPNAEASRGE